MVTWPWGNAVKQRCCRIEPLWGGDKGANLARGRNGGKAEPTIKTMAVVAKCMEGRVQGAGCRVHMSQPL